MDSMLQDLRYALRTLRRSPGLAAAAILTLGLGIGATTTIFTWMDGLVLRPFPEVRETERLVRVYTRNEAGNKRPVSYPDFRDWREQARSFEGMAAYAMDEFGLQLPQGDAPAERVWGIYASADYFRALGARPLLGRTFLPEEASTPGGAPVAVLGYGLWESRFGRDPGVVGRRLRLNGREVTVVGVMPPRFGGTTVGLTFDVWVPVTMYPLLGAPAGAERLEWRASRWLEVFARLRPGADLAQARSELGVIGAGLAERHPESRGTAPWAVTFDTDGAAQQALRPLLSVLLGMTVLVLLVVCANVANLLLARASARRREIGIRSAVGASRARLVRQMLTESLVLALAGGALGLAVAWWGRDLLVAFLPASPYPVDVSPTLNRRVLLLASASALLTALAFGLVPALRASRSTPGPALKGEDRAGGGRLRGALVSGQVALAVVALVCAGLFLRSLQQTRQVDPGFADPEQVLLVTTNLHLAGYRDSTALVVAEQLVARAAALPGVRSAAIASTVPLGFGGWSVYDLGVEGYEPAAGEGMSFLTNRVGPGYFATMGIDVLRGRALAEGDRAGGARVAVVNQAFADRFWPGEDPIGRRVVAASRWLTVVGVARDGRYDSLTDPTPPFLYVPFAQWYSPEVTLHLRAEGDPKALTGPVRREFAAIDPGLPFLEPRTLAEHASFGLTLQRVAASVLGAFGALVLLLTVVGLYGVVAYAVSQRTREIGIRMALGAAAGQVVGGFLRDGARLTLLGLGLGAVGAFLAARLLGAQLYGVAPGDPATFGAAALLLTTVALLASWLPARRAARVDPMIALRSE
jgi:predicted permease